MASEAQRAATRRWAKKNPDKIKAAKARYLAKHKARLSAQRSAVRAANLEKCRAQERARAARRTEAQIERAREWRRGNVDRERMYNAKAKHKNPARYLLNTARCRAKKYGLPFDLLPDDIEIPEFCPVFPWVRLESSSGRWSNASPTLDRLVPDRGYVRGNVRVISWRANMLRRDATAEELRLVAAYAASIEEVER